MIKITLTDKDHIVSRDLEKACRMAGKVDFLALDEVVPYMNVIYNAIQWGKNVK